MSKIKIALMLIGFFIILGTAGASDLGNITFKQTTIQLIFGLILWVVSFLIPKRGE